MAFSGGPDSVALTLLLLENGYQLRLAYVNYNLRGAESQEEERWVCAFAEKYALPLDVLRVDDSLLLPGSESLQVRARHLRYEWMTQLLDRYQIPWGVTAHTYDDLVETLVYQMLRGGDMWMWKGISFRRGQWLRPLLTSSREELIGFLREKGATEYRLDSSNYEPKYLRNIIRWGVLPALRRVHPRAARRLEARYVLYRLQRRRLENLYRHLAERYVSEKPFGGHIRAGLREDAFYWVLRERVGLSWRQGKPLYPLYRKGRTGAFRRIGEQVFCRVPQGLEWGPVALWEPSWPDLLISAPGTFQWGLWKIQVTSEPAGTSSTVALPEKIFPIRVRLWRKGDRIRPEGLGEHSKKLSDVWPALGLYGFLRRHAFVLEDNSGLLCYAAHYRRAQRISDEHGPFLYLSYVYGE